MHGQIAVVHDNTLSSDYRDAVQTAKQRHLARSLTVCMRPVQRIEQQQPAAQRLADARCQLDGLQSLQPRSRILLLYASPDHQMKTATSCLVMALLLTQL